MQDLYFQVNVDIQVGAIGRIENIWTDITLVMCLKDYLKYSIQVPNTLRGLEGDCKRKFSRSNSRCTTKQRPE